MKLYKPITVDLYNPNPLQTMKAKQGDTARGAIVTLTAEGSILEPTTEQIRIYAKKPDGTKIYNDCTIAEGKVKVDFTNQILAAAGKLQVELEMTLGEDILSTPIFIIQVLPTNIDDNAIESSNEFTALENALKKVDDMEIGGRNLLFNSDGIHFNGVGNTPTFTDNVSVAEWGATNAVRAVGTGGASNSVFGVFGGSTFVKNPIQINGVKYAASVYIKNNHATNTIRVYINTTGNRVLLSPGESIRAISLGTGNGTSGLQINLSNESTSMDYDVTYWHPMLEEATTPSAWVPAPEDTESYTDNRVQEVQDKLDNMQIGGRNILLDSAAKEITPYRGSTISFETGISVAEWGATDAIRAYGTAETGTVFGILSGVSVPNASVSGINYTHSIYVKNNGSTNIKIANNGLSSSAQGSKQVAPGEIARIVLHGTGNGVNSLNFNFSTPNTGDPFDFIYWHPMIEEGTVVTGWTPAPEDAESIDISSILNTVYPVGSIYMSINNTNPGTLFGGNWEAWGSGRVPVGIDTSNSNFSTAEKTGGASSAALTTDNMPAHSHTLTIVSSGASTSGNSSPETNSAGSHTHDTQGWRYSINGNELDAKGIAKNGPYDGGGSVAYTREAGDYSSSGYGTTPIIDAGAHTHTVNSHTHSIPNHTHTGTIGETGSGEAFSVIQPYITCYMWKRTA